MNCKQGDLAYVFRTRSAESMNLVGKIVTCKNHIVINGHDCWEVHPFQHGPWLVGAIADAVLKPIRGLPVPDKETKKEIVDEESMTPA